MQQKHTITDPATKITPDPEKIRPEESSQLLDGLVSDDPDVQYSNAGKDAYQDLFEFIRSEVNDKQEVMPLTSLTRKLEAAFKSSGISQLRDSTKKHIRIKIESEFGSTLQFIPDRQTASYARKCKPQRYCQGEVRYGKGIGAV